MSKELKTFKEVRERKRLIIKHDEFPEGPRENSNLGYFITNENTNYSPDKNEILERIVKETREVSEDVEDHKEKIEREIEENTGEKVIAIYPISKYEHSGVAYKIGNLVGWDYSICGFYIITDKTQKEMGTPKKYFLRVVKEELEEYNKFINGEVYRFILFDKNGKIENSIDGLYLHSLEEIKEYLPKEWKNEDLEYYLED